MRRIFFKGTKNGGAGKLRFGLLAVLLLVCLGAGGGLGFTVEGMLFAAPPKEKQQNTTEITLEKMTINVVGRGTLIFDARLGVISASNEVPDLQYLRDTTLRLATAAGSFPLVRQSEKVIPAVNHALGLMANRHGFSGISIENAALYQTGL
ncbi:hypothetical protein [Neptunicoccus cionae]|uniref:hypothetical protein n=1 Tax=Neptunicoccus cionae TaxID=2035344 RepID=UPI000C75BBC7|nr:hypothetical protein [Amylibacter cionae]PLS21136.1 hypothetical protein C0U40_13385 [Amylibacter cionae]